MRPNGAVLWSGASQIDGSPIVAIVTGLARKSKNPKTGNMLQTWILHRDIPPLKAITSGADKAICGDCKLRGVLGKNRACYVRVGQAPLQVWKAWKRGAYGEPIDCRFALLAGVGHAIRIGSYGDPCAVPIGVWRNVLWGSSNWTGYTHQWRDPRFQAYREICMASVDSFGERLVARRMGWRMFRVGNEAIPDQEIVCPASKEGGHKTTCEKCGLCKGNGIIAKNIVIAAHGVGAKYATG